MNTQVKSNDDDRVWKGQITEKLDNIRSDLGELNSILREHIRAFINCREHSGATHGQLNQMIAMNMKDIQQLQRAIGRLYRVVVGVTITIISAGIAHALLIK